MACHNDSISDEMDRSMIDFNDTTLLTNESTSVSTDHISKVKKQGTNENSASTTASPRNSNMNARRGNTVGRVGLANNLANGTVTIVIEKFKPLVLKLRNPQHSFFGLGNAIMPQDDIERMVDELGKELIVYVTDAVNSIRDEVKRARPHQDEENYELKIVAYQQLLAYITQIMKILTNVFSYSLTEFRRLIDHLWKDIQRSQNENEVQHYIQQFLHETEHVFQHAMSNNIEPLLEVIEAEMNVPK